MSNECHKWQTISTKIINTTSVSNLQNYLCFMQLHRYLYLQSLFIPRTQKSFLSFKIWKFLFVINPIFWIFSLWILTGFVSETAMYKIKILSKYKSNMLWSWALCENYIYYYFYYYFYYSQMPFDWRLNGKLRGLLLRRWNKLNWVPGWCLYLFFIINQAHAGLALSAVSSVSITNV